MYYGVTVNLSCFQEKVDLWSDGVEILLHTNVTQHMGTVEDFTHVNSCPPSQPPNLATDATGHAANAASNKVVVDNEYMPMKAGSIYP
mmetsp:Transcript_50679/g.61113  ORF Transcript_50679/g.61113 Transcript_50679/m.61113 type:complete len:88 (-) Transcript_50679:1344-1607(-)